MGSFATAFEAAIIRRRHAKQKERMPDGFELLNRPKRLGRDFKMIGDAVFEEKAGWLGARREHPHGGL